MAGRYEAVVDAVTGGFDVTQAQAEAFVNARYTRLVDEALFRPVKSSLGTTVSGTSAYALPADTVQLRLIRVESASGGVTLYEGSNIEDLWLLDADANAGVSGDQKLFAEDYSTTGVVSIRLWPTPDVTGSTIYGLSAMQPTAFVYGTNNFVTPTDYDKVIQDGAFADAYSARGRDDMAAAKDQAFAVGVARLGERKVTRSQGSGRKRIRVAGYDMPIR